MKWFPIVNLASSAVDNGISSIYTAIDKDGRRAPRMLDGNIDANVVIDTGACEFKPYRVTSNIGAGNFESRMTFANTTLAGPVYIEFDCSPTGVHSTLGSNISYFNQWIIDGFTQFGSAVPGPGSTTSTVTPGQYPNVISSSALILDMNNAGNSSSISGLAFDNQSNNSIYVNNTNSIHIFGNLLFSTNGDANIGIHIFGGNNHLIGGPFHYQRNVINGNLFSVSSTGILVEQSFGTKVYGNFIGTSANGITAVNNNDGVVIGFMASNTQVGGVELFKKNIVSGNLSYGISITFGASNNNAIEGNYIGLNYAGTAPILNEIGILIDGNSNTIGNFSKQGGNVISGNNAGIVLTGTLNGVYGNIIGLNPTGTAKIPNNNHGMEIFGSTNYIGNDYANLDQRNIVSGNGARGILINGPSASSNLVYGNLIGPLVDEINVPIGNQANGIEIVGGATNNEIGGAFLDFGNVISGNVLHGISIFNGSSNNTIRSNNIGVDRSESVAIPNGSVGIQLLTDCNDNFISNNMIAGNGTNGIEINASHNNSIFNNAIGCNRDIMVNLGNTESGITLFNSSGTYIEENNIHSNGLFGIDMSGSNSTQIFTNNIGGNSSSMEPFVGSGNGNSGIYVDQSDSVQIGDGTLARANYIKFNNGDGIAIEGVSTLVQHTYNFISDNSGLGIDIDADGVSVVPSNNEGVQAPVFTGAAECSGVVTIKGTLNGTPSTIYRLDFYKNTTPDASGSGEGETYIEKTYVTTDGTGLANINHIFSVPVSSGEIITAIASDSINGFPIRNSSEFAVNIVVQSSPSITLISTTNESCAGTLDGAIDVSISGGITPYTYTWYNSSAVVVANTEDATSLSPDIYYLDVTDNVGCIVSSSNYTIITSSSFSVTMSTTNITCYGLNDGTASVTETGGTGPFTYLWSPSGQTTQLTSGLIATTHSVVVTDALGCTAMTDGMVNEPSQIIISMTKNDPICNGTATGTATATISGGVMPYNYLWTPGSYTTATVTNLLSGVYSVQVTDGSGCTAIDNVTLIDPSVVSPPTVLNKDICNGENRTLEVSSPVGGTTYRWYGTLANAIANTGQLIASTSFTPTLGQTPVGQRTHFYVTATDVNGCVSAPTDVTITHRSTLSQPPIISGPVNLCPSGTYTFTLPSPPPVITITDAVSSNFNLLTEYFWSVPAGWTINSGQGTQFITVTASSSVSTGNISVVTSYQIAGYFGSKCNSTARTLTVNVRNRPTVNISPDPYTICEGTGGTINGNPTLPAPAGGFIPTINSHTWTGNTSILNATNVGNPTILASSVAGTYTLTYMVISDFGSGVTCSSLTDNATVNIVTVGNVGLVSQTNISCNGSNDGSITTDFTGGVGPYNYSWNSGAYTTQNISGLSTGTYQLTVIDGNGCSAISPSYTITEPAALTFNQSFTNESCIGTSDGTISIEITSGGSPSFTFELFNDLDVSLNSELSVGYNDLRTISGLAGGDYYIVVTDLTGCDDTILYSIPQPFVYSASFSAPSFSCEGSIVSFTDASSNTPTAWQWNFGDFNTSTLQNPTHVYASAGVYTVSLTTFWGSCSEVHTDNITINITPIVTNSNTLTVCSNDLISISLTASVVSSFTWTASYLPLTGGAGSGTGDINEILQNVSLSPAIAAYSVIPTSSIGCVGNPYNINVTVNPEPVYSGSTSFTICSGDALNINLTSPIASTWNWDATSNANISGETTTNQTTSSITDILINSLSTPENVTYNVQPTSLLGCVNSYQTITITVNPTPITPIVTSNSPICETSNLTLSSSNIVGAIYSWTGPNSFSSNVQNPVINGVTVNEAGNYSLSVSVNGCSSSSSGNTTVVINSSPTVSNAGINQDICVSAAATTLGANTPTVGIGTWSFVSGPLVPTFVNINSPTTSANGFMMPGVYVLEWFISNGSCAPSTSQVTITVNDAPTPSAAGSDQTICSTTGTVSMNANAPFVGLGTWTQVSGPASTIIDVNSPTTAINGLTVAGVYDFQWTISNVSCTPSSDVVSITVNEGPTVNASAPNNVCASESSFNVLGTQNNATSVQWSILSGSGLLSSTTSNASEYTLNTNDHGTTVILLFEGVASGCNNASDTVYIVIDPIPNAPTTADNLNQSICEGTTVNLSASSTTSGANIFWFSNAGLTNQIGVGTSVTLGPIVSTGNAYVVSSLNGCLNNNPLIFNLNSISNTVDAGDSVAVCIGSTSTLNGSASGNFYWINEVGLSDTTILNPTVNPIVDTYYYLVSINGGCTAMDSVLAYISADCETIQVTNSFSPNGDGVNDFFTIDGLVNSVALRVTIINRWGDVIADIPNYDNINNVWNGTYNGTPVPEGTYFYIIEYTTDSRTSTGWVQVIR